MLKKTIAALGLATAAAVFAPPAYAAASAPTAGTGHVVAVGASPNPMMAPMSDGSPTGGRGRR
ncbi:hypothetical protein AB0L00_14665 [Actinoallomurus sp. NPDC052308]|uniref:hypothetical protein n=1 Tax=Actinoallomurus TaxID=667113 RepID=UPI0031ED0344